MQTKWGESREKGKKFLMEGPRWGHLEYSAGARDPLSGGGEEYRGEKNHEMKKGSGRVRENDHHQEGFGTKVWGTTSGGQKGDAGKWGGTGTPNRAERTKHGGGQGELQGGERISLARKLGKQLRNQAPFKTGNTIPSSYVKA